MTRLALIAAPWMLLVAACSGGADRDTTVIIPAGTSVSGAADILVKAGAIQSAVAFKAQARLNGGAIRPGEYAIRRGMNAGQILRMLEQGKIKQRVIMIPEGMPSIMVRDRLMAEPALSGDIPVPEEGSILPNSYSFTAGESRAAVVARMQRAMDRTFDALWAKRSPHSIVNDRNQALTLASIVEKETGVAAERKTVAAVYGNRVQKGMRLDADPTIIYPITRGRPLGRRILKSEIQAKNDYNTYTMTGLPVGPICNPGKAAIAAVLNPARTDALYFVADGKGGHIFARTLDEHNANVAKWYAIRRQRGEM